jgi:hypothetical protein
MKMKPMKLKTEEINPMSILEFLDRGDITVDRAVSLLRKHSKKEMKNTRKRASLRKAHWLRIRIRQDVSNCIPPHFKSFVLNFE